MEGRCLCEHIHFSVSDDAVTVVNCHCNLCRKMNGSAFSTYVVVQEQLFELKSGEVKSVQVSENASKHYCQYCGTPVYNKNPKLPGLTIVYLGAIDSGVNLTPVMNIYCESQLNWVSEIASFTHYDQGVK
ncbi:GFA family protein [Marisediminitalea sp.]|uniref:GFA family protein n=1 Tax=Marisediminitalea sp. TaxID=2662268 RepID=UPI003513BB9C